MSVSITYYNTDSKAVNKLNSNLAKDRHNELVEPGIKIKYSSNNSVKKLSFKIIFITIVITTIFTSLMGFWIWYLKKSAIRDLFGISQSESESGERLVILRLELASVIIILLGAIYFGRELGFAINDLRTGHDIKKLDDYSAYELPTKVFDINGEKITEFFLAKRQIIPYNHLPDSLIGALIAMEDNRFYIHRGVDSCGILRAMFNNVIAGRIVEGGSTISQQLAKLLFTKRERTLGRKALEIWLTVQIEKRYSKQEILEKYFNHIYFDHGVYGVEAASKYFFGKSVRDINIAESAMLVSIPPRPRKYSPFRNPKQANKKQYIVLSSMLKHGMLPKEDIDSIHKDFWIKMSNRLIEKNYSSAWLDRDDKAPYFSEYVRQKVKSYLEKEYGDNNYINTGGLKIYTTLDISLQKKALEFLRVQLAKQDKIFKAGTKNIYRRLKKEYTNIFNFIGLSFLDNGYKFRYKQNYQKVFEQVNKEVSTLGFINGVFGLDRINHILNRYKKSLEEENLNLKTEGALVAMEPNTGYVMAMVGGRRFSTNNQLNRALSKRQPGSAFKAFVYGAAFKSKLFYPAKVMFDDVYNYDDEWIIHNAEDKYSGPTTLREAIKFSKNTIAVKVIAKLGVKRVIDFASSLLGIKKNRLPSDPSIALGTGEISPLEMTRGISVYANGGKAVEPITILKIVDRYGHTIKDYRAEIIQKRLTEKEKGKSNQIISPELAYLMTNTLQEVIDGGSGYAVRSNGFQLPAAGKTGTTQSNKDAWFAGYTPNLAAVVWVGFDKGVSLGHNQYGGTVAAPVWSKFMKFAHNIPRYKYKKQHFNKAKNIEYHRVCKVTGLRVSDECIEAGHESVQDIFLPGSYPKEKCEGHKINENDSQNIDDILDMANNGIIQQDGEPEDTSDNNTKDEIPQQSEDNTPTQNTNPKDSPTQNTNPKGNPTQNTNPKDSPTQNTNPKGNPTQNTNPKDSPTQNTNPKANPTQNTNPKGNPTQNTNPKGNPTQNTNPKDSPTQNTNPKDSPTQNTNPKDSPTQNTNPKGNPTQNTNPKDSPTQNTNPKANPTQNTNPKDSPTQNTNPKDSPTQNTNPKDSPTQ